MVKLDTLRVTFLLVIISNFSGLTANAQESATQGGSGILLELDLNPLAANDYQAVGAAPLSTYFLAWRFGPEWDVGVTFGADGFFRGAGQGLGGGDFRSVEGGTNYLEGIQTRYFACRSVFSDLKILQYGKNYKHIPKERDEPDYEVIQASYGVGLGVGYRAYETENFEINITGIGLYVPIDSTRVEGHCRSSDENVCREYKKKKNDIKEEDHQPVILADLLKIGMAYKF